MNMGNLREKTCVAGVNQLWQHIYLELHDALVVLRGELGVLEEGVLHVDQVPLIRGEAVQDESHLGEDGRLQTQFGQRGRGALDGGPVLSVHAALHGETKCWLQVRKTVHRPSRCCPLVRLCTFTLVNYCSDLWRVQEHFPH